MKVVLYCVLFLQQLKVNKKLVWKLERKNMSFYKSAEGGLLKSNCHDQTYRSMYLVQAGCEF